MYNHRRRIVSVFPGRMSGDELLGTPTGSNDLGWYDADPETLILTWNGDLLTNNSNDLLDVKLFGYMENNGMVSKKVLTDTQFPRVRVRINNKTCINTISFHIKIKIL